MNLDTPLNCFLNEFEGGSSKFTKLGGDFPPSWRIFHTSCNVYIWLKSFCIKIVGKRVDNDPHHISAKFVSWHIHCFAPKCTAQFNCLYFLSFNIGYFLKRFIYLCILLYRRNYVKPLMYMHTLEMLWDQFLTTTLKPVSK